MHPRVKKAGAAAAHLVDSLGWLMLGGTAAALLMMVIHHG